MRRKIFIIWGSLLILFFLIWLGFFLLQSSKYRGVIGDETMSFSPQGMGESFSSPSSFSRQKVASFAPPQSPSPADQKKIIENGSLTLVIDNTDEAVSYIAQIAQSKKGFVASLNVSDDGEKGKKAFMSVRVPVDTFTSAMEEIKALAQIVEVESVNGQDVTEQYIDLEARLKNLRATEAQFLEILKSAKTVEDTLKVQDRLSQTRGEIESFQSQLKYLANQTDLATITITLSQEPTISLSFKDFRPITVIKTSLQALAQGLIVMFNILVRFIFVVVPILLISGIFIVIILLILWRLIKKVKQRLLNK